MRNNEKNPLDEKHIYPDPYKNSKKDICHYIRKSANHGEELIKETEEIPEELFKEFTDINEIEKLIFEEVMNDEYEYFVLRLYVVKSNLDTFGKKLQGLVSKYITNVGTTHLAVQINDKMVHWYDSGLVLVKPYEGANASAIFHPQNKKGEEISVIENTKENRSKICKIIQKYNCVNKYDVRNCNCQTFAQEIFEVLDLKSDFKKLDGPVGFYLKYIINKGKGRKEFAFLVDSKQKVLKENDNEIVFTDHKQLDMWSNEQNLEKYSNYNSLIKAFHRAFQMRENSLKRNGKECYQSEGCPFTMPTFYVKDQIKQEVDLFTIETNFSFKKYKSFVHSLNQSSMGEINLISKNDN